MYEADDYTQDVTGATQGGGAVTRPAPVVAMAQSGEDEGIAAGRDEEPPVQSLTQAQRIDRVEQQLDNLLHADSGSKMNHFQEEVQALRGKVEELTHQLEQMQHRQQAMYTDLDRRIASRPSAVAPTAVAAAAVSSPHKKLPSVPAALPVAASQKAVPAKAASQPNVAEEQQTYQLAYDLIKTEKYDQAVAALQGMLHKYPSGQFASNAHYWLGELYGLQGKNALSAAEFQTVMKQYPGSPRMADAGLKLGLIYAAEFKWREAKSAFHNVINRYPGTASARLAAEQLKQIRQSDH